MYMIKNNNNKKENNNMKGWREYVNVCFEKMWQEKKKTNEKMTYNWITRY